MRILGHGLWALQYGRAGLSSSGSRGQRQCSGVLMSDLQEKRRRRTEGWREEVRGGEMKERRGRG